MSKPSPTSTMTWQQKLKALNDLAPTDVFCYYPNPWCATIRHTEVKDGYFLTSACDWGETPEAAVNALWEKVKDRRMVVEAYTTNRHEVHWNGEKWVEYT